jgi:hypothetical protein
VTTFNGTNPQSANLTALDPYGDQYVICTTNQYDLSPSTNSSTLAVLLQTTDAITAAKTTKQMQQEAEQNGTLRVYNEWSWCFPWYRAHCVSVYEGRNQFDQGISPIPFVGATLTVAPSFLNMVSTFWWRIAWPIAAAVASAEFYALLASNGGPEGFLVALAVSQGLKWGVLWVRWNDVNGLVSALMGNVFAIAMGLVRSGFDFVEDFLKLLNGIADISDVGFGNLYRICSFPANIFYIGTILNRLHALGTIA